MGAELTNVHVLRGHNERPEGSYHVGGGGIFQDEAYIRALAESMERYAQLMAPWRFSGNLRFCPWTELDRGIAAVVDPKAFRFFTDEQFVQPGFPFQPFDPAAPMSWLAVPNITGSGSLWVPTQLLLIGYPLRRNEGEPWLMPGVTTGTAAHTVPRRAVINAILELVQLDGLMGHWCSGAGCPEILPDTRTPALLGIMRRQLPSNGFVPSFFLVPNADLPGFSVTCLLRHPGGGLPQVVVGAGVDFSLEVTMYKALVEATGVLELAEYVLFEAQHIKTQGEAFAADPSRLYDLDRNVAWYALPGNARLLDRRFGGDRINASDLGPDGPKDDGERLRTLIDGFSAAGHDLVLADFTPRDVAGVGITVARAWSPQTLSLSLPSLLPLGHARLKAYGGAADVGPHPYP